MYNEDERYTRATEYHKSITFHITELVYHLPAGRLDYDIHASSFQEYRNTVALYRREVNEWVASHYTEPVLISENIRDIPRNDEE
jgi:hypothetical protein